MSAKSSQKRPSRTSFGHTFCHKNDTKKQIRAFNFSRVWAILIDLQYKGLTLLFTIVPIEMQWILAFMMPIMREGNFQIMNYIMIKSANVEDERGKIAIIIGLNTFHALYVSIKLGHTATAVTSSCILVVDAVLNLYSCYGIIKMHQLVAPEGSQAAKEKKHRLVKLILIETLEVLVPLAYLLTVVIAYYGPNGEILGNIRNSLWQYKAIDDIGKLILAVLLMFVIDLCSAIIAGISLWKICSVHLLREAYKVMDNYWMVIAINIANYLNYVSLKVMSIYLYIETDISYTSRDTPFIFLLTQLPILFFSTT